MNFVSFRFLIFFPIVLCLHRIAPPKFRWIVLLAASYYAYMVWNVWLVFLILGVTAVSYAAGILIKRATAKRTKKFCLIATLVVCLGLLVVFKYLDFLYGGVIDFINLFKVGLQKRPLDIILPVGISFYTFQTLSYVIDVYRGKIEPERHFGYYALFVSFFPQLVAGPIERPDNLLPQLKAARTANESDLKAGLGIMLCGFVRKVVIADFAGVFVDKIFSSPQSADGLTVVLGAFLFGLQIYCDFAGYSEIAIGSARMLGVRLTRNFDSPYSATSIRGFWRRWHITLTSWFTDYIYIPLGGNRKGKLRQCLNIFIVFAVSGLWHGAAWNFLLWGVAHGLLVIAETLLEKPWAKLKAKLRINDKNPVYVAVMRLFTLVIVGFTWILFRAQSLGDCAVLISKIFAPWNFRTLFSLTGLGTDDILRIIVSVAVLCLFTSYVAYEGNKPRPLYNKAVCLNEYTVAMNYVFMVIVIALAWAFALSSGIKSSFIYFQF